jgi:hypothetical protein
LTNVPGEPVEAIRNYGIHALDARYVGTVFETFGIHAVGGALEAIVRSGDRDDISDGLAFLEDTIRFGMHRQFPVWYWQSPLLQAVRDMVCGADAFGRHLAMYAMARTGPASNGRVLAEAVPWYLEHDPLGLSDLLYNLHIFARQYQYSDYRFVQAMVSHPLYLTRWAAVRLLSESPAKAYINGNQRRQLLRRLAQDDHPRVRAESRWALDQRRRLRAESLPRWHRAAFVRRIFQTEPYPPFWIVQLQVSSYLQISGQPDYTPPLVEAVARYLSEHPISSGNDPEAYWQAFQTAARDTLGDPSAGTAAIHVSAGERVAWSRTRE